MAKLDTKQRNALSDSDFAFVDKDGVGHLPINDAAHVRAAMARFDQTDFPDSTTKAKARSKILAAAKRFGIDVSNFANPLTDIMDNLLSGKKAEMSNVTLEATFAVESEEEDGDDLILKGRLFHAGEYPEQSFSMTPLELHDTISRFIGPAPLDLHHRPNIFGDINVDGAFGQIEKVWADDTGEWIMAQARKPKWLQSVMPEQRVSATFSRSDKSLIGAAWTHDPVVPEAAFNERVIAAFAKHSTPTGQYHMQNIHDATVRGGAVCNKPAAMASRHENAAIQQAHDIAVQHGAKCETVQPGQSMPAMYANDQRPRSKRMNLKELLLGTAKAQDADADETEIQKEIDALFSREPDPKVSVLEAALKEANDRAAALEASQKNQDAQFAKINDERRHQDAVAFANKQVVEGRLPAAAAKTLVPLAESIAKHETTVQFAEGEPNQSSLLEAFMASLGEAFAIFGKNVVPSTKVEAMFSQETTPGVGEAEARDEILKKMRNATPAGRAVEKEKQNGNHA